VDDEFPDVPPGGGAADAEQLSPLATEALDASPFPAIIIEVAAERIVAASPSAMALLAPGGGPIVGHLLEEFTSDRPAPGPDLFAGGRLNGFETFRQLRRSRGPDVRIRMWVRSFDHQSPTRFVMIVFVGDQPTTTGDRAQEWQDPPAVVGTADATLLIERISSDAEQLFSRALSDMLGGSLLALVVPDDVPAFLAALAEASATQTGITVYLDIRTDGTGSKIRCEVLLLPLQPAPSCAFVFLPTSGSNMEGQTSNDLTAILLRLGRGAHIAQLARGVFRGITEDDLPGLSRLTTRELEIVTRLVDGYRVPAIAGSLFLSQSTVRNHLASVFSKLRVASQQQLLDAIRHAQAEEGGRER
jgi:DNA-binding CsgD family transcriptional regulator